MLGGAASEYPNGRVFSSIMIYSDFMTDALTPAETTEGYLTVPRAIPEDVAGRRVVPCRIGGQLFGVDVAQAGEMMVLSATVPVALAPARVRGVINQHGRMATVIETRAALGLPAQDPAEDPARDAVPAPRVGLTVEYGGHLYILAVDEVREIVTLEDARDPITPLDLDAIVRP
jgi:chemotaxis signal transduction protein